MSSRFNNEGGAEYEDPVMIHIERSKQNIILKPTAVLLISFCSYFLVMTITPSRFVSTAKAPSLDVVRETISDSANDYTGPVLHPGQVSSLTISWRIPSTKERANPQEMNTLRSRSDSLENAPPSRRRRRRPREKPRILPVALTSPSLSISRCNVTSASVR